MLERVIENWLDKAGEKTFQEAFCAMLAADGHTIIHLTRHCAMELGKDILTIGPDGIPCAFQLKGNPGSKITLSQWRNEISSQVFDLVVGKIVHPSIASSITHRAFLVTNGEIDEEVGRAIDDMNRKWADQGQQHKLEVIVRGQLLSKAKMLGQSLWPSELTDVKTFLEIFLSDGRAPLQKGKLVSLLGEMYFIDNEERANSVSKAEWRRIFSSSALLTVVATSSYKRQKNHLAEIEAWTIYTAHLLSAVDRFKLPKDSWRDEFQISMDAIYNCLFNLYSELKDRTTYLEGDSLVDQPYGAYGVRMILLIGLMSNFYFLRRELEEDINEIDTFIDNFCEQNIKQIMVFGEAAVPHMVSACWKFRLSSPSKENLYLKGLFDAVLESNQGKSNKPLPNPYYLAEDLMPHILGIADREIEESFAGSSYSVEGLMHLLVRKNQKEYLKAKWPAVTRMSFKSFEYKQPWHFYRWRNEVGLNSQIMPAHTQEWNDLFAEASKGTGETLPETIKSYPAFLALFIGVYPFRMNTDVLRFLDENFKSQAV